jgi:LL-diaminopimelate aminotransferase
VRGAKEVGIEFHSLSKTFNMTGWRLGFAAGHSGVLAALGKIKSNLDSGAFQAIQEAGITALNLSESHLEGIRSIYQSRRDAFIPQLKELGFKVETPKASFYTWVETPKGIGSTDFTKLLLEKAGIVSTPGNGFGEAGEGYIRMTLTVSTERLLEATQRIKKAGIKG